MDWIVTGIGNAYTSGSLIDENCFLVPIAGDFVDIPGNGAKLYANTGTYPISKKLIGTLCTQVKEFVIVFARGNSMEPTIYNGDSMLVDTSKKKSKMGVYIV